MSEYPLIIEKGSNYAFVINESKNLDFDKIRDYSTEFYKMLPSEMQERLYDEIMHGACELDSEPKLNAYMFALGKMHNAKLQYAYDHLSDEFLNEKQIDIIDYACGQGVGTICYADFLKRKHLNQNVRRIILIEPSEKALARAALNISAIFPDAKLVTINKGFDDLTNDDLFPDKDTPTLHVISNVLDMATTYKSDGFFDLEDFANLISRAIDGKNEFVCVEPLFGYAPKDEKVDAFIRAAGIEIYCSITKGKREFVDNKDWTCVVRVGKVYKNVRSNANISNFYFDEILKKAEQGDADAQNNLGYCYYNGQGVAQDYEKAVEWYRKSAKQGAAVAQEHLSILEKKIKEKVQKINGHEYVDLGLPSGLKWATCNVGANSPEEYGDYYAWGEVKTKMKYSKDNYAFCHTKEESGLWEFGYGVKKIDNYMFLGEDISETQYDVARKKWGGNWRMPTYDEMEELVDNCYWEWTTQNGVKGYKVTGPNGNSIFLPAAGYRDGSSLDRAGSLGNYWSSTPNESNSHHAWDLNFNSSEYDMSYYYRYYGRSVRPVSCVFISL